MESYSETIKTPPLQIVPTIEIAKEAGIFHFREQDKVSFTARLTSFILQQYKIWFKVELKYIKSAVVVNRMANADEGLFSISRKANGANKKIRQITNQQC